jgi:hypothetical protein
MGLSRGRITNAPTSISFEAAAGYYGTSSDFISGQNPDVAQDTLEDIWDLGGIWVGPVEPRIHNLTSTNVNDTLGGTGLQVCLVVGLDEDYLEVSEDVVMDGLGPVATINRYSIIHRLVHAGVGSAGANLGTVSATAQVDATVTCAMRPGTNLSRSSMYVVPDNKAAYLTRMSTHFSRDMSQPASRVDVRLFVQRGFDIAQQGGPPVEPGFIANIVSNLNSTSQHSADLHFTPYFRLPPRTLIKLQALNATQGANEVTGYIQMVLEDVE